MDKTLFPLKPTSEAVLQRLAVNAAEKESERAAAKPRWRGKLLWGFVLLLVLGGGGAFAVASLNRHDKEALPAETGTTARAADAVVVTAEAVRYQPVQRRVEAVGTLYGYEEVSIAAKMDGRVRRIHHDVSDRVKPGDLLVEFDPTDYELLLRQAEKALRVDLVKLGVEELSGGFDLDRLPSVTQARERMNNARLRLDRARALARASAATTEDVSDKTADFRAADAEYHSQILQARSLVATVEMRRDALAIARQQLADMAIKAPPPPKTKSSQIAHSPLGSVLFVELLPAYSYKFDCSAPNPSGSRVVHCIVAELYQRLLFCCSPVTLSRGSPVKPKRSHVVVLVCDTMLPNGS